MKNQTILASAALLATVLVLSAGDTSWAQAAIQPIPYLMVQKDLPAPYRVHDDEYRYPAYFSKDGHWYRAGANPEGLTDKDFDYKEIHEEIWNGNWTDIQVEGAVFANPAVAQLRLKDLEARGWEGRYKKVDIGGVTVLYSTTDQGEFPRYDFVVGNVCGAVYGGAKDHDDTLAVAKLWLDKLTGRSTDHTQPNPAAETPAKELPDLHVESDRILLSIDSDNSFLPFEPAADQQSVALQIENRSPKTEAQNVYLQLYVASPAGSSPQPVGKQLALGRLAAGDKMTARATWDLGGKNQVDVELWAKVYVPYTDDANPADNQAHLKCSIRYAFNGQRAFSWSDDTYRFTNFGYQGRETEEMVEGLVATLLGNLQEAPDVTKAFRRLTFAAAYDRITKYLDSSQNAGAGGHCYGMSATAGLYFEGNAAPPLGKATPALTLEEASTSINLYHRAQMLPLLQALSANSDYLQRDFSPRNCYNWVKNALDASRLAPIIEFFGRDPNDKTTIIGHAVLAYKLIEVEGRDPVVYVYDSNFPASMVKAPHPMPQITLRLNKDTWSNPTYMGYDWAVAQWISAHRVAREISVDMANALAPQLKAMAYAAVGALHEGKQIMAILRCPADVYFTDDQGRRTGVVDGKLINDIPGAGTGCVGEVEMYLLPRGQQYQVTISGNGTGDVSLDLLQSPVKGQLAAASFDQVPIRKGGHLKGVLTADGQITELRSETQAYALQWSANASVDAYQPAPATTPQPSADLAVSTTFDADDGGWRIVNLSDNGPYGGSVSPIAAEYQTAGGNPGGCVSSPDPGTGNFFFQAPTAFLGDKAGLYGGTLRYDLKSEGGETFDEADVVLVGGGLVLLYKQPEKPTNQWRTFVAPLTEKGWTKDAVTGAPASAAEFRKALSSVTALRLRGEFRWGSEVGSLDNVSLCGPGK